MAHRKPSLSLVPGDAFSEVWEAGIWAGGTFPGWTWSIQTAVVVTGLCTDPGQAAFEETSGDHLVKPLFPPGGFVADFVGLRGCRDGKTSLLSRSEKPVQSSIPYFAFILTTVEYCRVKDHNSLYWRITGQCLLWSLFLIQQPSGQSLLSQISAPGSKWKVLCFMKPLRVSSVVRRCPAHPADPVDCSVSQHLNPGNVSVGQVGAGNSLW